MDALKPNFEHFVILLTSNIFTIFWLHPFMIYLILDSFLSFASHYNFGDLCVFHRSMAE